TDTQALPTLASGRDLDAHAAVGCRDRNRRAQGGFADRDRHVQIEIVAAAFEQRMRLHPYHDVEIAGGTATVPRRALARDADTRSRVDAGGDAHVEPLP